MCSHCSKHTVLKLCWQQPLLCTELCILEHVKSYQWDVLPSCLTWDFLTAAVHSGYAKIIRYLQQLLYRIQETEPLSHLERQNSGAWLLHPGSRKGRARLWDAVKPWGIYPAPFFPPTGAVPSSLWIFSSLCTHPAAPALSWSTMLSPAPQAPAEPLTSMAACPQHSFPPLPSPGPMRTSQAPADHSILFIKPVSVETVLI